MTPNLDKIVSSKALEKIPNILSPKYKLFLSHKNTTPISIFHTSQVLKTGDFKQ